MANENNKTNQPTYVLGEYKLSPMAQNLLEETMNVLAQAEGMYCDESDYAPLMHAVANEAQLRLCGFIENLQFRMKEGIR